MTRPCPTVTATRIASVGLCGGDNLVGLVLNHGRGRRKGQPRARAAAGPDTLRDYFPSFLPSFNCTGLTSLTLPQTLTSVGRCAFCLCDNVTSVVFRPPASRAFIAWSVGNSRKRANWQLTTLKRLRNVLRLVTAFAFERRVMRNNSAGTCMYCHCLCLRPSIYDFLRSTCKLI